jgi:hypothetical protein
MHAASCYKTNLSKDWDSYWFYMKDDMSKIPGYKGLAHPLCLPIVALTATYTAPYNPRAAGFRNCESAEDLVWFKDRWIVASWCDE